MAGRLGRWRNNDVTVPISRNLVVCSLSPFHCFAFIHVVSTNSPFSVSKPTLVPPHSRLRALTSSESPSESSLSEYVPFVSLVQPQCLENATSHVLVLGHIVTQPSKAIVDIGQVVGENPVIPLTLQSYRPILFPRDRYSIALQLDIARHHLDSESGCQR